MRVAFAGCKRVDNTKTPSGVDKHEPLYPLSNA